MDIRALYTRISPESSERLKSREDYASAASQAGNTKAYQRAAETALVNLQGVKYADQSGSSAALGRPMLAPPAPAFTGSKAGAEDKFTLLMASLINLLGEASVESLNSRMAILKAAAKASADGNSALSAEYLKSVGVLEQAVEVASGEEQKKEAAKTSLEHAKAQLATAQQKLSSAHPDTPEHDEASAQVADATSRVDTATQAYEKSLRDLNSAIKSSAALASKAEALAKQIESKGVSNQPILDGMKAQLNASATMTLLMMQFAELMGESAENKIDMEQELFRSMQAARQEHMERKADEYAEEVRKAEAASKTMGCIGKIMGAVLMVVGVVAAAFTGGASLAIAAVGVAVMAADMIVKELTGVSFMEQAMKPLMDLLGPLIQHLGKEIAALLKKFGVDEKSADMAGMIMGAIIGAMAMVAVMAVVMTVGKSAASKMAGAMTKAFGDIASKLAPDLLKQAARSVSKTFTQTMTKARSSLGLKSDALHLNQYATRVAIMEGVAQAGSASAESSLGIKSGVHQRNASDHLAAFKFSVVIAETMKVYLSDMVQAFDQLMKAKDEALKKAFAVQENANSTALNMARNI